ncbi:MULTISPECIES: urease accessory protein UreF [unclassified Synechocystis]|uniref:urease accessory protein UreF n=1 Tax=unclassified Synechocystis TaxID=2640012 RepID=UPI00048D0455|nr:MULTISPECIES: urease accessory protein UreF [unclassified Synechocystis]MCT0253892.1 urease accessory protein UreF [Synechocystis sp. CS-94]
MGAYNYSEGLEWLIEQGDVTNGDTLGAWLVEELRQGSITLDTAIMVRAYRCANQQSNVDPIADPVIPVAKDLDYWNQWLTATRESRELREQSLQMGSSLRKLLLDLDPTVELLFKALPATEPCHYAIAFGVGAAFWGIDIHQSGLGYLHSWANNLISAGVRLIPLGQTTGQKLLLQLTPTILGQWQKILVLEDDDLYSCSWGLALASMGHESQYTRLFRS